MQLDNFNQFTHSNERILITQEILDSAKIILANDEVLYQQFEQEILDIAQSTKITALDNLYHNYLVALSVLENQKGYYILANDLDLYDDSLKGQARKSRQARDEKYRIFAPLFKNHNLFVLMNFVLSLSESENLSWSRIVALAKESKSPLAKYIYRKNDNPVKLIYESIFKRNSSTEEQIKVLTAFLEKNYIEKKKNIPSFHQFQKNIADNEKKDSLFFVNWVNEPIMNVYSSLKNKQKMQTT